RGARPFLADAPNAAVAQAAIAADSPGQDAALAFPHGRLRLGRPVHAAPPSGPLRDIPASNLQQGSHEPGQTQRVRFMERPSILETCDEIIRARLPNLLRLYLNPYVAKVCHCLNRYVQTTWPDATGEDYQSFLANSFDEALSGAIKLARYASADHPG